MNQNATCSAELQQKLSYTLLIMRLSVFLVLLMWTLDKFINPGHATKIFEKFYGLAGVADQALLIIAALELVLIGLFVLGIKKRLTYGVVLVIHAASTFSSYQQYMDPFKHLLFFAAWPMLAACAGLYLLRDWDTLLTVKKA